MLVQFQVQAQRSVDQFGKNRVQHKIFDWKFITSKHFYVYYYQDGERIAYNASRHLEREYENIINKLGLEPYDRIEIIVYNSVSDLQQSNIGLRNVDYIGGKTNLVKARIEVPFKGSHVEFEKDLIENVCRKIIEMALYGGGLKETIQATYSMSLPDWFLAGCAAYIARGDSPEMREAVYDAIKNNRKNPLTLRGDDARLIGQSIWHFFMSKNDEYTLTNMISLVAITHNEEQAMLNSVGLNYKELPYEWEQFYRNLFYNEIDSTERVLEPSKRIKRHNAKQRSYNDFEYSPDGKYLAYSLTKEGRYKIKVQNIETGKTKTFSRGGVKIVGQVQNKNVPVLAWRSPTELSVVTTKKGLPKMLTKDVESHTRERKEFVAFEEILDIDYSRTSPEMVISAVKKGHSDIYLYQYKTDRARQITNDLYDDFDPKFIPNTNRVIFSSNRRSDTLGFDFGESDHISNRYDLFTFPINQNQVTFLTRITDTDINEFSPTPLDSTTFLVKVKKDEKYHIALLDKQKQVVNIISDYAQNVSDYSYSKKDRSIVIRQKNKLNFHLLKDEKLNLDTVIYSYSTVKMTENERLRQDTLDLIEKVLAMNLNLLRYTSDTVTKVNKKAVQYEEKLRKHEEEKKLKTYGPYDYRQQLMSTDYIVSNLLLDPLRGAGIMMQASMTELFFNHKLNLSINIQASIRNSNYYAEYEFLKYRNDLKIRFKNENIFRSNDLGTTVAYNSNHFEFEYSHPFSQVLRMSLTPLLVRTGYIDYLNTQKVNENSWFTGVRGEIVLDNTKELGLNMLEGTRMKMSATQYNGVSNTSKSFTRLNLDYRKYTTVFRKVVFAGRAGYGKFLGNSKKTFLLGGMDNWLFSETSNANNSDSPLNIDTQKDNSDLLFIDYVTNVRGFSYNKMYGEQYLIFNAELRFPIAQMITNKPIRSPFFRNILLTTFYDAGSAWDGGSPFSKDNSINTQEVGVPSSPFKATVTNYLNPFLQSYGMGIRSMLFGYYMKMDLAWPIEHYNTGTPRLYFTLGYDF